MNVETICCCSSIVFVIAVDQIITNRFWNARTWIERIRKKAWPDSQYVLSYSRIITHLRRQLHILLLNLKNAFESRIRFCVLRFALKFVLGPAYECKAVQEDAVQRQRLGELHLQDRPGGGFEPRSQLIEIFEELPIDCSEFWPLYTSAGLHQWLWPWNSLVEGGEGSIQW